MYTRFWRIRQEICGGCHFDERNEEKTSETGGDAGAGFLSARGRIEMTREEIRDKQFTITNHKCPTHKQLTSVQFTNNVQVTNEIRNQKQITINKFPTYKQGTSEWFKPKT